MVARQGDPDEMQVDSGIEEPETTQVSDGRRHGKLKLSDEKHQKEIFAVKTVQAAPF